MLFHTTAFAVFLGCLILALSLFSRRWLLALLVIASYVFYGWAQPQYLFLIFATSIVDYWVSNWFVRRPHLWRLGIVISAVGNFGVLAYFKYANFFIANFHAVLATLGVHADQSTLNIILPIGISFHTFQSFCYIVDVLRGKFPPCKSLILFLLYVSYFPQLVAGPIERPHQLLPQLAAIPENRGGLVARFSEAAFLFAEGWLRKAFADWLAITANSFFVGNPSGATRGQAIYGILAFGFQIYGDFSGYTRMAQGISWLFGVRLMENFNLPYIAVSFRDFWTRWHISLSRWFRDYLYIPLGGDRARTLRNYANLIVTMLVSGLWHGAAWTFVIWGALHAAFMAVERFGRSMGIRLPDILSRPIVIGLTFLAWVPFRASSLQETLRTYAALSHAGWGWPPLNLVLGLAGIVGCDVIARQQSLGIDRGDSKFVTSTAGFVGAAGLVGACIVVFWLGALFGPKTTSTFIYFQF